MAVSNRIRNEYESYNFFDYNYNTNTYDIRSNLSALINLTYSYRKSKFSWKTLYNNDFIKTVGIRNGYDVSNGEQYKFNIKSTNTETSQNGIINSVVEGSHSLNRSLALDWNGSYSRTYRWQPDQKILALHTDSNSDIYNLTLSNENSPEIRNAGRVYSFKFENIYGSNINITKQYKWLRETQKLKIGTSNYYRDRNVEVNALGYSVLNSAVNRLSIPESKTTTFNSIFSPGNIDAFNLTVANIATNSTDYTGTALMNAGFAMLDNKFSDKIKLNMGCKS